jgi:hypothetical protein
MGESDDESELLEVSQLRFSFTSNRFVEDWKKVSNPDEYCEADEQDRQRERKETVDAYLRFRSHAFVSMIVPSKEGRHTRLRNWKRSNELLLSFSVKKPKMKPLRSQMMANSKGKEKRLWLARANELRPRRVKCWL